MNDPYEHSETLQMLHTDRSTTSPIDKLQEALKDDEYRYVWKSNLAMYHFDAIDRKKRKKNKRCLNRQEIHEAMNEGSEEFLRSIELKS